MAISRSPLLRALAQPNYRRYASGNAVSLVGTWIQRVAVGWLAWELTHSATWLGLVALADLAPAVILGPLGGAVADRRSPLAITFVCQVLAMIASLALTVLTVMDLMTAPMLVAVVALQGMAMGFNQPARLALVYSLVEREHLPSAIAFNSVVFNTARFIGPAVAGGALVASGPALAFGINTASFVAYLVALAGLKLQPRKPREEQASRSIGRDMLDGARYAASHALIGPLLLFAAIVSVTARAHVELLPGFADAVLGGGAATLALLSSVMGIGAVASGLWLANRSTSGSERFVALCILATAASVAVFAASTVLWLSVVAIAIGGAAMSMAGVSVQTRLQLGVDADYRARVMSLYGVIFRSGPALGALVMGAAADRIGLQWPVLIGAGIAAVTSVIYWRSARRPARGGA